MRSQRWFRIEGYHAFTRQDTRSAAGQINRHVIGVQFVVSEPVRIRHDGATVVSSRSTTVARSTAASGGSSCRWPSCVLGGVVALRCGRRSTCRRPRSASQSPTLSPELLRGVSSMDPGRAAARHPAAAAQPDGARARHPRREDQPVEAAADVAAWLRDNLRENIEVPLPIGLNGRPDPVARHRSLLSRLHRQRPGARAAHRQPRRVGVRRGELEAPDRPRREHGGRARSSSSRDSQAKLTDLENKLRAKKQNYMGRLPDQIGANVQMVNGARSQLESLSMQIRTEQDHLIDGRVADRRRCARASAPKA